MRVDNLETLKVTAEKRGSRKQVVREKGDTLGQKCVSDTDVRETEKATRRVNNGVNRRCAKSSDKITGDKESVSRSRGDVNWRKEDHNWHFRNSRSVIRKGSTQQYESSSTEGATSGGRYIRRTGAASIVSRQATAGNEGSSTVSRVIYPKAETEVTSSEDERMLSD